MEMSFSLALAGIDTAVIAYAFCRHIAPAVGRWIDRLPKPKKIRFVIKLVAAETPGEEPPLPPFQKQ